MVGQRKTLKDSGRTSAILVWAVGVLATDSAAWSQEPRKTVVVTQKDRDVDVASFVFDGHNDLPWAMRTSASSSFEKLDISQPQPEIHTDIARLRKGNVGAQFWSVYVPASTRQKGTALSDTVEQIELVHAMVHRYPGVEGGHSIENSIANLRRLFDFGARYMTLTHSDTLDWADSATDDPKSDGLSAFGEEIVREMNRLGMLVDLSHVSPETMVDALRVSEAPVIFSHSSARAVADHPRNVPDDVLQLVTENGGVVMVNFFSGFVHPESALRMAKMFDVGRELRAKYPDDEQYGEAMARWRAENPIEPGSIHDLVDHIAHLVKVAGVDHVGIGSDYDGVSKLPTQLEDVSTYPVITQALLDRGFAEEDIHKIMSGNIMRAYREAEKVSERLRNRD